VIDRELHPCKAIKPTRSVIDLKLNFSRTSGLLHLHSPTLLNLDALPKDLVLRLE
jgi:hypothetical protein